MENKWSGGIIRILEEIDLNVYIIALIRDYGEARIKFTLLLFKNLQSCLLQAS